MTGRAPLTEAEKRQLYERKRSGATHAEVAGELGCSSETVRKWWRRQRQGQSPGRRGRPRQGALSSFGAELRERCLALKRAHPHWGPALVKLELRAELRLSAGKLPSNARLSAAFKGYCPQAVQPRRPRQYPDRSLPKASRAHERWQIDAKEKVTVGTGEVATVLEVRDPCSALMLEAQAFLTTTEKGWRKLTLREVQETLRSAFRQWGLPCQVQTDHEDLYTGAPNADFPSPFTLWLAGLGIQHVTSRDRRPTDQAQIERNHRTLGDMAYQDQSLGDVEALQAALDRMRGVHNEELPLSASGCAGRPPLLAYPQARHSGRPYDPGIEWTRFDLGRVDAYLASFTWVRQISASGCISLGHQMYGVGRAHRNQRASARFEPATRSFHFQLADGTDLGHLPARGLEKIDLIGFAPLAVELAVPIQLPLMSEGGTILCDC